MLLMIVFCAASCSNIKKNLSILIFHSSSGTIGHVAHGKSTVVKAISGVQVCIY